MKSKVLIPQPITQVGIDYLKASDCEIVTSGTSEQEMMDAIRDCDAVLARTAVYSANVIDAAPKLKIIARHGVGVDSIDYRYAEKKGIWVAICADNALSVAEHVIYLILCCAKRGIEADRMTREGRYAQRNSLFGTDLAGKTLGVMGMGRIGRLVSQKARLGLDMKILGYDPFVSADRMPEGVIPVAWPEELFEKSDFITLHLPATEETHHMIQMDYLKRMKSTAYLINAARGEIVKESDLAEALKRGILAGAGLDVYDPEPPQKDNPLFALPNVVLTPHTAAITRECMDRLGLGAAKEIVRVLNGEAPLAPVNKPEILRG